MSWRSRTGSEEPQAPAQRRSARRSVYEQRLSQCETHWTTVGEIDNSGQFATEDGWERRVGGWQPFDEFLSERTGDPLAGLPRDRGPL